MLDANFGAPSHKKYGNKNCKSSGIKIIQLIKETESCQLAIEQIHGRELKDKIRC